MMGCGRNGRHLRKKSMLSIDDFLGEPYTNVMNGHVFEKMWNVNEGKWF